MPIFAKETVSIILGGGAGSRLHPLTASRSKPAVPIGGKYRLVDIPISNCINSNLNRIFVLTQFNSASLNQHIKNTYHFSAFSSGFVDILAAEQTPDNPGWFQGTADAVRQSLRHLAKMDFEYVLILSGDQLYQMDFSKMIEAHKKTGAALTIATIPVGEREAPEFGILKSNQENVITSFVEKPKKEILKDWTSDTGTEMKAQGRNYLASMGIYVFNKEILYQFLNEVHPNATDFGKEIIPDSIANYKVLSYQYDGYWTDIGNIYSFFEANIALTQDVPLFNLFDSAQKVYTRARMLPPAKVSGTIINKAILAEGCIIHAKEVTSSVVGIRARVGKDTVIKNTYIMGCDYYENIDQIEQKNKKGIPILGIGERCIIEDAIIDKNCSIGNDVIIKGGAHLEKLDHPLYTIKDGIVVVKKGAVIPNGYII
jgi:glucose-1-phosphate adenylyltransferase